MTLSYPDLARLCRGFAMLLHSGVGMADGAFLLSQEEQEPLAPLLSSLGQTMDKGTPLSDALEQSGVFPEHLWSMIRVGESTGQLEQVLEGLADYYETRSAVKQQLRSAVAYPGTVLVLMLVVLGVLLVKVLPIFETVYASLGRSLTGAAASLLHTGRILKALLPVLFGLLGFLALCGLLLWFCPNLREKLARFWQRRYGDRGIARKFNNAHFAQALSLGLSAGLSTEEAVSLAETLLRTVPGAARRCANCIRSMDEGQEFIAALEETELLPPSQRRLLHLGLRSGNADQVMETVSRTMQKEAWDALEKSISSIEPTLVLVCSGLIGLILLSVLLPLADILSALG